LGAQDGDYHILKQHAFFEGIDWTCLHNQKSPLLERWNLLRERKELNDDSDNGMMAHLNFIASSDHFYVMW
jgi:hypothetical protein